MGHQNVIIQHRWQFIFLPPQIFIIKKLNCPPGIKRFIIWEAAQIWILLSISHGNNIDISAQKTLIGILHISKTSVYKFQIFQSHSLQSHLIYFNVFLSNRKATLSRKEEKSWFYAFKLGEKISIWLKPHEIKTFWKINS